MSSKRLELFNSFVNGFHTRYDLAALRCKAWTSHIGKKYPEEFYRTYRDEFVPYWKQFGIKPPICFAKEIQDVSGKLEAKHIPDNVWMKYIVPYFNNRLYSSILADKNLNGLIFPTANRPETLFRHMSGRFCLDDFSRISYEKALALCRTPGEWVIKPSYGSFKGFNVNFFTHDISDAELAALLKQYDSGDYIVQRAVKQHPDMARLNPTSINTVRVVTAIFKGSAFIESAIIRMGTPGSRVDNVGSGGTQCGVLEDGSLMPIAYFPKAKERHRSIADHPVLGGFTVPGFQRVRTLALELAQHMPHLNLIAWDFAISEDGEPILIEFNTRMPGQNYETNGPSFRDCSEELLTAAIVERKKQK